MELPQALQSVEPRSTDEIAAAARAVQANVVTLRVALVRRLGDQIDLSDINTPAPGPVSAARELLLAPDAIKTYSNDELMVRLRQVWGEFCALCWLFPHVDPQNPVDFAHLPDNQTNRCQHDAREKLETVQSDFWRILHEQRRRHDGEARFDPHFQRDSEKAAGHRLRIYGINIGSATDMQVFHAACEYAGMLAALRWALDARWTWEGPGIMKLDQGTPPRT